MAGTLVLTPLTDALCSNSRVLVGLGVSRLIFRRGPPYFPQAPLK